MHLEKLEEALSVRELPVKRLVNNSAGTHHQCLAQRQHEGQFQHTVVRMSNQLCFRIDRLTSQLTLM